MLADGNYSELRLRGCVTGIAVTDPKRRVLSFKTKLSKNFIPSSESTFSLQLFSTF